MFREIQIKNFRGLKDSDRLQLTPLTVFTGTEGSGKSTVGHLLTMLKQTVHTSDSGVVLYSGDQDSPIQLGTQSSIIHNNADGPLEFSYRFDLPDYLVIEDSEKDKFGVPHNFYLVKVYVFIVYWIDLTQNIYPLNNLRMRYTIPILRF